MLNMRDLRIFSCLMWRDMLVMKKDFWGDLINLVTWPTSLVVAFGIVLPAFGMIKNYGSFLLVGALGTSFFYLAVGMASELVSDFETVRAIEAQLIVPVSSYKVILVQRIISFALHSFFLAIPLLPIGKILLGDRLDCSHFSIVQFVIIMMTAAIFFGALGLTLASLVESSRAISNVWRRIYTPMQLVGCYWFSFDMACQVFPQIAYIALINPLTFVVEGIRASVFGAQGYLPFWISESILLIYIFIFAWYSFTRIKRRLDVL